MPTAAEYQEAGRKTKAFKLATILSRAGISADMAKLMSEGEWVEVAHHAGQKPPSGVTVRYTLERLEEFARTEAAA